eukprot:363783-Chlamydomonas_euryale.AAC.11
MPLPEKQPPRIGAYQPSPAQFDGERMDTKGGSQLEKQPPRIGAYQPSPAQFDSERMDTKGGSQLEEEVEHERDTRQVVYSYSYSCRLSPAQFDGTRMLA